MSLPEPEIRALMTAFDSAPKYNRRRAEARREVLKSLETWVSASKSGRGRAEADFVFLYRDRRAPGLEPWVYDVEKKFSLGTLRRWRTAFKNQGLAGLLAGYGKKKGRSLAVTPEMRLLLAGQLSARPSIRPARLYEMVSREFSPAPTRSTVYRFVKTWKAENAEVYTLLDDPRQWKNNFLPAFGDMAADTPHAGHTWEMDSTPADVMTLDGRRCAIIGTIDIFSRRAVVIVAPTSKSLALAACIRRGILAWGVPARIRKDNGADYKSRHIQAITTALDIKTPKLPPYQGEAKPFIERFFGTMTRQLEELLPGYVGHSVAERQALRERAVWGAKILRPSKEPVPIPLTMKGLQEVIDEWLEIYERRQHSGLKNQTPLAVYESSPQRPAKIRDERVLDILLAPVGKGVYTVLKKGLLINGGQYTSEALVGLIGQKVQVRQDLQDAGLVYVFAESGEFICRATDEALTGQALGDYIQAKKRHVKEVKQTARALRTISLGQTDPYTVLKETGEIIDTNTGEVVPLAPEADTPAVREARQAAAGAVKKEKGLADEMGVVIPLAQKRDQRAAEERAGAWDAYPEEFLDNPILLYEWLESKDAAVGLSPDERDHQRHLVGTFPWLKDYLSDRDARALGKTETFTEEGWL